MSILRPIDAVMIDDVLGTFFGIEDEKPEEDDDEKPEEDDDEE